MTGYDTYHFIDIKNTRDNTASFYWTHTTDSDGSIVCADPLPGKNGQGGSGRGILDQGQSVLAAACGKRTI